MGSSSNLRTIKVLDANDLTRFVVIDKYIEKNISINHGGSVEEGAIDSGSVSLTIDQAQWETAKALGDILFLHIEGYWGGKIALDEVTIDFRNHLASVTAYGWLDYADSIRYLDKIFDQAKLYGINGELFGSAPLFFPNLAVDYFKGAHAERGRVVTFLKNDPYKTQREAPIEGEYTVSGIQKVEGVKALVLDGLPDPPSIEMQGRYGSIAITGTHWRPVITIPVDTPFGVFTAADLGGIITVDGLDDYNGDYVIYAILVPGTYLQEIYCKEVFSTTEKAQPSGSPLCSLSIKVWRQKKLRFRISERWKKNIAVKAVINDALEQLGIPEPGRHISLSLPTEGDASLSTLARGYSAAASSNSAGILQPFCAVGENVFFGMRWFRCYVNEQGEYYPTGKNCIYDFCEDQSGASYEGTGDVWYSYSASTQDWEIRSIVHEPSTQWLWLGLSSDTDGEYIVKMDVSDLENATVTDVISSGYGMSGYSHVLTNMVYWSGKIIHLSYDNFSQRVYVSYVNTTTKIPGSSLLDTLYGQGQMQQYGYGAVYEDTDRYITGIGDAYTWDIDLTTITTTPVYARRDSGSPISIAVAQGEDTALLWFRRSGGYHLYRYVFSTTTYTKVTYSNTLYGGIAYSATKPGTDTPYKRFWTYYWDKLASEYIEIIGVDLQGNVDAQRVETYSYNSYGQWVNVGMNLVTALSMEADYSDDPDVSLVQLGKFTLVLRSPNFTGQSLREIIQNMASMACCWLDISWDRSAAYFYSRNKPRNALVAHVLETTDSYTYTPYDTGAIADYIDMGQWRYPVAPPIAYQEEVAHSVYGEYIDSALLASSIGELWYEWLRVWLQKLEITICHNDNIQIGSLIYWQGTQYMIVSYDHEMTREVDHITAHKYFRREWNEE